MNAAANEDMDENENEEAEIRRIYNLIRILTASDSDSEDWSSPAAAKRAFKMLRVGRSIGSMAHRLPRMG